MLEKKLLIQIKQNQLSSSIPFSLRSCAHHKYFLLHTKYFDQVSYTLFEEVTLFQSLFQILDSVCYRINELSIAARSLDEPFVATEEEIIESMRLEPSLVRLAFKYL